MEASSFYFYAKGPDQSNCSFPLQQGSHTELQITCFNCQTLKQCESTEKIVVESTHIIVVDAKVCMHVSCKLLI